MNERNKFNSQLNSSLLKDGSWMAKRNTVNKNIRRSKSMR